MLQNQELFDVRVEQLSVGDVVIGDLGIERKTADDFVRSLFDGRLFRQLILLRRSFRRRMLLIEGRIEESEYNRRAIRGALLKTSGSLNIPIVFTSDLHETAHTIQQLTLQLLIYAGGQIRERSMPDGETKSFYQTYILAGIPGIGVARAKALIQHFGTLSNVFKASVDEIQKVPQVGPVHAKRIYEISQFKSSIVETALRVKSAVE